MLLGEEVEEEDSRELRGRIRIATMMPSSVPPLLLVVSVVGLVEEGASLDIVLSLKRSISIECYCYSVLLWIKRMQRQLMLIAARQ